MSGGLLHSLFGETMRQVSGRAPHGEKEKSGRTKKDIVSHLHNMLKPLVGKKYGALKTYAAAAAIAHAVGNGLEGNDRDGWKFAHVQDREEARRKLERLLRDDFDFDEKGAEDVRRRIMDVVWPQK